MSAAPYTEVNEPWPIYERGWWVVISAMAPVCQNCGELERFKRAGKDAAICDNCSTLFHTIPKTLLPIIGIGNIEERKGERYGIKTMRPGRPFEWHHKDALTLATKSQVGYMEGTKV